MHRERLQKFLRDARAADKTVVTAKISETPTQSRT